MKKNHLFKTLYCRIKSSPNLKESKSSNLTPSSIVSNPSPSNKVCESLPPTTKGAMQILISSLNH